MKYRKKPVVIEAFQWDGSIQQLLSNVPKDYQAWFYFERQDGLRMMIDSYKKDEPVKEVGVASVHGGETLRVHDYIVFENGHYTTFDNKEFEQCYEKVQRELSTEYEFDRNLLLVTKDDELARFWTKKKAKEEAIKAAHALNVDFVAIMTIVSGFYFMKNRMAALITKDSTYGGKLIINADGTLNEEVKSMLSKEQNIRFK